MIDDMLQPEEQLITETPDVEMLGREIDDLGDDVIDELEMLGIEIDDVEMMGGIFRRLARKIRDRIRARRKRRAERKAGTSLPAEEDYTVTAPGVGTLRAGPGGVSFARPLPAQVAQAGIVPVGPMAMIQKNPMLLVVPAVGLLAVFMMMQQKRPRRR